MPDSRPQLSSAPATLGLAIVAVLTAGALLLGIGVIGGVLSTADADPAASRTGIILSTFGVVFAGVVLWKGLRALGLSLRRGRQTREGDILAARESASTARVQALLSFGLGSILVVATALAMLLTMNDGSIQKTFFRTDLMSDSAGGIIRAFGLNVFIACVAEVFILVLGLALAVARTLPGPAGRPVRAMAIAFIDVMRATPAIIVLYLIGFGLPLAGVPVLSGLSPAWFAIIALTLTYSAYVAEIYRSGIESVHASQTAASRSLGFSYGKTLHYVILPQAVRAVIPPLLGMFISLQKDTSLVNIIGAVDAFNQAKYFAATNFNLSSVTVVAVIFVIVTIPQTRFVDWQLERSAQRRRGAR